MIGKLKGRVENIFNDHLLLDVHGVCYIIYCSTKLVQSIKVEEDISLFIHMTQKDAVPILYGFVDYHEKELFILLISVQGVGGKMGIALIGDVDYKTFCTAIQNKNPKILQQVPGIGSKIALRIINELKSNKKFLAEQMLETSNEYLIRQDAISALINLGFKRNDVVSAVDQFIKENTGDNNNLELIIKSCISKLG